MNSLNVLGEPLQLCSRAPITGFQRDGFCHLSAQDYGLHGVCAIMDEAFLEYTFDQGNDLSTPRPEWGFPGLQPGDRWCLCIDRWLQAYKAGIAPKLVLEACHENLLQFIDLETLQRLHTLQ